MSFGKMRTPIDIVATDTIKDADGFSIKEKRIISSVRAYKEDRRGNETWKNRASFSTASSLFCFRKPHNFQVTTDLNIECQDEWYNILSVVNIEERGMYIEVLAEKVVKSRG